MDTVTRFDPVAEHERTRAALTGVLARVVAAVRDAPDRDAASGLPGWTVGDVGAHLAAVYLACGAAFTGEEIPWNAVLPGDEPGDAPLVDRITALNARAVALLDPAERDGLADLLARRGADFLRATEGLAPDTPVAAPWYGEGVTFPLSAVTGLMLSESLVHGLDLTRGTGARWPIAPHEAALVLGQFMPTVMPMTVDAAKARGVRIAFDLALKGGPRLAVVVDDGSATVVRDAPPRRYDCRITADPVMFLLVSFRRVPIWKAVATGRMRAGGRRPWLATRLGDLIGTP
ncbi:maleylpyruvate isomerase N-terminal domain-containing protein [Streptomyces sp. NPDC050145]|uniref:maleylpyruvate isomerase N-terminal domain-containing protein n=1 Tax=Streptomyces sp. NPDC050145 TaxID=3365602 RepID=UPI0037BD1E1C